MHPKCSRTDSFVATSFAGAARSSTTLSTTSSTTDTLLDALDDLLDTLDALLDALLDLLAALDDLLDDLFDALLDLLAALDEAFLTGALAFAAPLGLRFFFAVVVDIFYYERVSLNLIF
jgi:ABC-type transporter Mla subunit MlaD